MQNYGAWYGPRWAKVHKRLEVLLVLTKKKKSTRYKTHSSEHINKLFNGSNIHIYDINQHNIYRRYLSKVVALSKIRYFTCIGY
jgi:hypothetical protein